MFIFKLSYQQSLDEVEKHLPEHRNYLDKYYALGHFVASGPQEPRTGGIILCRASSKEQALDIMRADPFYLHQIAKYEITEFTPTKYAIGFDPFIE